MAVAESADFPGSAGVPAGSRKNANEDVGAPKNANENADVPGSAGVPAGNRKNANEDVGVPKGWYSRGYLPHCDVPQLIQSITFRLADSLPHSKLAELQKELERIPEQRRGIERRKRIEAWLDAGMGCCALAHPDVARYVQNSFLHFHGERYHLHAWCIMPNHVHVLVEPLTDLASIVQGWKSYTARWVLRQNKALGLNIPSSDKLWMREYWDRYIRNARHYQSVTDYIHQNPVKAGLCHTAEAWRWSSAFPGNADVLVGNNKSADEDVGTLGAPTSSSAFFLPTADRDVGAPKSRSSNAHWQSTSADE